MSNPYDKPTATASSILGPTLKFKGELTANEDLLIQGKIEGSINHTSNLTIGKEGKIKANVKAEYISIEGSVDGDLSGSKAVVVKEGADVKGNIQSVYLSCETGGDKRLRYPSLEAWSVPPGWNVCTFEVAGKSGTRFTVHQLDSSSAAPR